METPELIDAAKALWNRAANSGRGVAAKAQVCEFLTQYAGPQSAFAKEANGVLGTDHHMVTELSAIMSSYIQYLESGLSSGSSPERKAQLDVVSDILGQAQALLDNDSFHPAAAAVIIGASLEEFLRTWVEASSLSLGTAKPSIDAYAKTLRTADLISKQDLKDVTAWAGIRNDAAHGDWEKVSDRNRIRLMLEGVNLFLRQKTDAWAQPAV